MRIGVDVRLWNESGVGRYIRNLIFSLQVIDKKNEYVLFALHQDFDEIISFITNPNFHVVGADVRWHTLAEQITLPQILSSQRIDLMHFPYFSVPIFYNKPYIVTIHDLILHHFPTGEASTLPSVLYRIKQLGYKMVIAIAAKKANKIITILEATKSEIIDHLKIPEEKIVVIYEGVDKNLLTYRKQTIAINAPFFLHVGNVYPHKNVDRLIDAFSIMAKNNPQVQLVFVGKTDYFLRRLKKRIYQLQCREQIVFLGEVTDEKLSELYQETLGVIIPSYMEGFGLPAVEAMANKCLVIASKIPALVEVCSDAAIYFDPNNTNSIASVLEKVYTMGKGKYKNQLEIGEKRIKMFSWQKMAEKTLTVYESSTRIRQN